MPDFTTHFGARTAIFSVVGISLNFVRKRKDGDRLAAIYNQVHQFSLLDPDVQVYQLKSHLIAVGGQRRDPYRTDL